MLSISCSLNLRLVIINGLRQLFNFAFRDFVPGAKKSLSSFTSFLFCLYHKTEKSTSLIIIYQIIAYLQICCLPYLIDILLTSNEKQ